MTFIALTLPVDFACQSDAFIFNGTAFFAFGLFKLSRTNADSQKTNGKGDDRIIQHLYRFSHAPFPLSNFSHHSNYKSRNQQLWHLFLLTCSEIDFVIGNHQPPTDKNCPICLPFVWYLESIHFGSNARIQTKIRFPTPKLPNSLVVLPRCIFTLLFEPNKGESNLLYLLIYSLFYLASKQG